MRSEHLRRCLSPTAAEFPLPLPILLALSLAAASLFYGTRGLYESTEGRYAECAREMARTGSWLEPVLQGSPHWTKPPLAYLAIREPCRLLGPTTWAARLFLIPCYLATVASVWWLTFRLWEDRKTARMSALVFATSAAPLIASQIVSTDYLLTAALAAAQACAWEGFRKRSGLWFHLFWFALGVAFLVKGPPSLLAAPAVAAVWLRLPREQRRQTPLFAPTALALFLVVASSWYAWEASHHPGLLAYWLNDEVVNRSFSDKFSRNPHFYCNFTVYLPVLLVGSLPWGGWLAARWRKTWAHVRVAGGLKRVWRDLPDPSLWLALAVLVPLCVFALSRSKLPLYLLPLFVPCSVAAGRLLLAVFGHEPWFRKRALATALTAFAVFAAGKAASELVPSEKNMRQLHRRLTEDCGITDAAQLATVGKHPLCGLSYYFDGVVANITTDQVRNWAAVKRERFLLCDGHKAAAVKRELADRKIEERILSPHYHVLRIAEPSSRSAAAP